MRIIIAGGSGLIGTELARELLQHGYDVVVLSRSAHQPTSLPSQVNIIQWDGYTVQGWGDLVDGSGVVVNLAGENLAGEGFFPKRWTDVRKKIILQSRLNAGNALVEAIRVAKNKPFALIQSSAIGYYGPLGDESVDESYPAGSDFLARTCVAWENSTSEVEDFGVRQVVIRTGVVLSAHGGAFMRLMLPFKFFVGGPLGNGKQYLSWIHIADVIGAIRFLIENPQTQGVYNLTAPRPVTNSTFAKTIGQIMRRPAFIPIPAFVFQLVFGEVSTVVVDGQYVTPKRLTSLGYTFRFQQVGEAVGNLLDK